MFTMLRACWNDDKITFRVSARVPSQSKRTPLYMLLSRLLWVYAEFFPDKLTLLGGFLDGAHQSLTDLAAFEFIYGCDCGSAWRGNHVTYLGWVFFEFNYEFACSKNSL